VAHGIPLPPDPDEPARVAQAVVELVWNHVVVTSVTRDDLPDGGAAQFVSVVREIREKTYGTTVELLVPDFQGNAGALASVIDARPDVLAHNVETVPRLYPIVRPQAEYRRSLMLLQRAKSMDPSLMLKSGLMVGFGENLGEVIAVMEDLYRAGCRSLTVGQYLPPFRSHSPVKEYRNNEFFESVERTAREIGFLWVASGPLVRSSYKATI
jgi:lipoic acid synthetase